jgi:hypothetical protein
MSCCLLDQPHNIAAKYGYLRKQDMRSVVGNKLKDEMRSKDIRELLQSMVEEIKQYQRKRLEHVERRLPNI